MSDFRINFGDMVNSKDTTNLSCMLGIIDNDDRLTIVLNDENASETDTVIKVLKENGFTTSTCGGKGSNFYISAKRNNENYFEGIH